jgi:hypothetical protein
MRTPLKTQIKDPLTLVNPTTSAVATTTTSDAMSIDATTLTDIFRRKKIELCSTQEKIELKDRFKIDLKIV